MNHFQSILPQHISFFKPNFAEYFNNYCEQYFLYYSIAKNDEHKVKFECVCGGRIRATKRETLKSKFQCRSFFTFHKESDIIELSECNLDHTHEVSEFFSKGIIQHIPQQLRDDIAMATKFHSTSGGIRTAFNLICSPHKLYNMKRHLFTDENSNQSENLENEVTTWKDWIIAFKYFDDGSLCSVFFAFRPLLNYSFVSDFLVTDDTACTNIFDLPLAACFAVDPNGYTQLPFFGILCGKSSEAFQSFFEFVKFNLPESVRVFIVDRSKAQISGILAAFPESDFVYCFIHIHRNLLQKFGDKSEIGKKFNELKFQHGSEEEFINLLHQKLAQISDKKNEGKQVLQNLIDQQEHWLPFAVHQKTVADTYNTNRAEGEFGHIKNALDHKISTLVTVCRVFKLRAEAMLARSISAVPAHISSDICSFRDQKAIGKQILLILEEQWKLVPFIKNTNLYYDSNVCDCLVFQDFHIPCRHILQVRLSTNAIPLVRITDIPERWIFQNKIYLDNRVANIEAAAEDDISPEPEDDISPEPEEEIASELGDEIPIEPEGAEISHERQDLPKKFSYTSHMEFFERYIAAAKTNPDIERMLQGFRLQLSQFEINLNQNDPPIIKRNHRRPTHPSFNVDLI
jgi:hypothetical protein